MSDEYNFQFEDINSNNTENTENNDQQELDLNSFSSSATTEAVIKKKKKKRGKQRVLKIILTVFLVCIITFSIIVGSFAVFIFTGDYSMDVDLNDLKLNFTTTVYIDDGSGNYVEYTRLHGMYDRIWMGYDRTKAEKSEEGYTGIPQNLVDAFIAIEDKRFGSHTGTDWRRTFSAFANMLFNFSDSNFGGSTITQQLVKNLTDDADRSASRKIREIMRARYLEENYSKDVIIECYLNTIAMGHGTYGVEAAANYYFDKSVNELTLTECAALAAITKSPSYYAPDTNPEANLKRRNSVLYEMYDQGYITKKEYESAKDEELNIVEFVDDGEKEIYSYYVDALIDQVVNDLVKEYNYDKKAANLMFFSGGYKIYATLDPSVQTALESVYTDSKTYGLVAKDGAMMQGAMTVMDYNGNVKGLVGGIGEKVENRGLNRATDAIRQPGSTIKPISAYSLAIENNIIYYSSILNDTATNYNGWKPVNWYGSYTGNITAAYALERSVNTIPVYLINKMTPQVSYDFLTKKLGITTLNSEDINLSPMGMGGTNGGITTFESAAAFAIFGNNGLYYKPHLYTKVLDQKNEVILSYENIKPNVAITEDTATIMNHMLQNVVYTSHGTAAGAGNYIPHMKFYAKTGTTNDQKDLWFVGGSPYYVASAWCGYDIQQNISTSSIAQKMWGAAMSKIHNGLEAKEFVDSEFVEKHYYCTQTGLLATDACPTKSIGWYKTNKNGKPGKCQTHDGTVLETPKYNSDQEEKANASQEADNNAAQEDAQ